MASSFSTWMQRVKESLRSNAEPTMIIISGERCVDTHSTVQMLDA